MPVVAAAYNNINGGNRFAYAVSYDWAHGYKGAVSGHPNKIMIHAVKVSKGLLGGGAGMPKLAACLT